MMIGDNAIVRATKRKVKVIDAERDFYVVEHRNGTTDRYKAWGLRSTA